MNDIFLSYKREDQSRVAPIVDGLRAAGLSVWWDRDIGGGESWRQSIVQALEEARCVIVVWSTISVGPLGEFVHDEAGRAKRRGVLLPVRLDAIQEPVGFGEVQSLDLVGWTGNPKDRRFQFVVATAKAIVTGGPRPRPKALGSWAKLVAKWGGAFALAATFLGFVTNLAGLQKPLCKVPGLHSLCAVWGLGGVPTREETALWKARKPGDCAALRTYVERYPKGAFAEEAGRRLQAKQSEDRWSPPLKERLPLVVRATQEPLANEEAARADAVERGKAEAAKLCRPLEAGGLYRIKGIEAEAQSWRCASRRGGVTCGFEGEAVCQIEQRMALEVCP